MLAYTHKQKLTVPNSLALVAAAIIIWNTNPSTADSAQFDASCSGETTAVTLQAGAPTLPYMQATPAQCQTPASAPGVENHPGDSIVKTMQSAGLRLLYLPAKALVNN